MATFSTATIINPLLSSADNSSWINNPTGMEGLPTPIAPVRPNAPSTTSTSTSTISTPSFLSNMLDAATNYLGITKMGAGVVDGNSGSGFLTRGVFIVLGLLLIAAGIFSFSKSQPVVQEFVKGVGTGVKEGITAAAVA